MDNNTPSTPAVGSSSRADLLRESLSFYHALRTCEDTYIAKPINTALDVLDDACRLYGMDNLLSSYNGGKDADVIMHLLRAVAAKLESDTGIEHTPKLVLFVIEDEFPEVLEHIEKTQSRYNLDIARYECGIMQGLKLHVDAMRQQQNHSIAPAFVLGTRKGDPNCGDQETFAPSSKWMPVSFMRVNPILNWEYGHVWHFLRTFNLPYCSLYEQGYTSLGKRSLTQPNPALRRKQLQLPGDSPAGEAVYWPAYMLSDWTLERAGRSAGTVEVVNNGKATTTTASAGPTLLVPEPVVPGVPPSVAANGAHSTHSASVGVHADGIAVEGVDGGSGDVTEGLCSSETLFRPLAESKSRSNSFDCAVHSAALLIIGDEILNGFTADVNIQITAQALRSIGVPLKVVSVISDSIDEISAEVLRMSQKHDVVITSGGIGATHDDVTLKAVARALNQEIKIHPDMVEHLQEVHNATLADDSLPLEVRRVCADKLDEAMLRLAMLPERSKLRFPPLCGSEAGSDVDSGKSTPANQDHTAVGHRALDSLQRSHHHNGLAQSYDPVQPPSIDPATSSSLPRSRPTSFYRTNSREALRKNWPVLQVDNIFVLPGVPQYYAAKIDIIVRHLLSRQRRQHIRKIVLDLEERALVSTLDQLVAAHRDVKFGSYPFVDHPEYKTIITLEGTDRDSVEHAVAGLLSAMPPNTVLRVEKGMAARKV